MVKNERFWSSSKNVVCRILGVPDTLAGGLKSLNYSQSNIWMLLIFINFIDFCTIGIKMEVSKTAGVQHECRQWP